MSLFKVFRLKDGTLTTKPEEFQDLEFDYIGEFKADVECDFIMNMIKLNIEEGNCDTRWTEIEEHINKEGL
jgi:hypothetical protein